MSSVILGLGGYTIADRSSLSCFFWEKLKRMCLRDSLLALSGIQVRCKLCFHSLWHSYYDQRQKPAHPWCIAPQVVRWEPIDYFSLAYSLIGLIIFYGVLIVTGSNVLACITRQMNKLWFQALIYSATIICHLCSIIILLRIYKQIWYIFSLPHLLWWKKSQKGK